MSLLDRNTITAARTVEDANDIRVLADRLALRSADEVLAVVLAYFPAERLPVRVRLLLEEMFEDRKSVV